MVLKGVIIVGAIIVMMLVSTTTTYVSASQEKPEQTQIYVEGESELFYREDGYPRDTKNRPAINPDFAPDRSCDLKWELKCIPGSEQKCSDLRGYNNGEMNVCTPIGCPDDYHNIFDDEDNICHSNEKECPQDGMVLAERKYGDSCIPKDMAIIMNVNASVNNDDDMINDIPPDGEGLFCDNPSHPGGCYDRNDDPEEFCITFPEYTDFCKVIGDLCDEDGSIKPEDEYCRDSN